MREHEPTCLGQSCLAGTHPPLDQVRVEELLERRYLLADRGLAESQSSRCRRQRAFLCDRFQRDQMTKFDSRPPKGLSYSSHCKYKMAQKPRECYPFGCMFSRLVRHFVPRRPRVLRAPGVEAKIVLRLSNVDDKRVVERLAALYDQPVPDGPLLLAEVDGELLAALTLAGDQELMEPFLPTAALVELLRLRAKHLATQAVSPTFLPALRRGLNRDAPRDAACQVLPLVHERVDGGDHEADPVADEHGQTAGASREGRRSACL